MSNRDLSAEQNQRAVEVLRQLMKDDDVNQLELAKKLDVEQSNLSKYISGKQGMGIMTALRLFDLAGLDALVELGIRSGRPASGLLGDPPSELLTVLASEPAKSWPARTRSEILAFATKGEGRKSEGEWMAIGSLLAGLELGKTAADKGEVPDPHAKKRTSKAGRKAS